LRAGVIDPVKDMFSPGLPPRQLRRVISPLWFDYVKTGQDQIQFFERLAGLQPTDRFLDVACGVGRIAVPLTQFLNERGRYEGFDIAGLGSPGVKWCQENIQTKYPNFNFSVVDLKTTWTPNGSTLASEFEFPYPDSAFDFVYGGSIFTHLTPAGGANYLKQARRVLTDGGRFVATWLVYNRKWAAFLGDRCQSLGYWKNDHGDYRTLDDEAPEASIAFDEAYLRKLYRDANLEIVEPLRLDASYCPARIPSDQSEGLHLYYSCSIVAIKGKL
jgi:SAM-dependent methyltransferase